MREEYSDTAADAVFRLVETILKAGGVLLLLSTLVSFSMNLLLMDAWGIPFSVIATPSDMIVGGAESVRVLFPLFVIVYLAIKIKKSLNKWGFPNKYCAIVLYISIIILIFLIIELILHAFIQNVYHEFIVDIWNAILWVSTFLIVLCSPKTWDGADKSKVYEKLGCLGLTFTLLSAGMMAFDRSPVIIIAGVSKNCDSAEYVVWTGSHSLITSCGPPPFYRGKDYYVVEREGLTLRIETEIFSGKM